MNEADSLLEKAGVEIIPFDDDLPSKVDTVLDRLLGKAPARRRDVLDQVIAVARSQHAKTVVVEKAYVDMDYLQTYSQHYSKAFHQKPSQCARLHFFAVDLTADDVLGLGSSGTGHYLGFTCLRPTGDQYVSRTVVAPPQPPDDKERFVHATAKFSAHLLGQRLEVRGTPFIQQDVNTFICAGAALWTIGLLMHQRIGIPRFCPGEISGLALERFSHAQLRKGLTTHQMVMTLREMGLNPHVESWFNLHKLHNGDVTQHKQLIKSIADYIHVHVDSDLPPLLACSSGPSDAHAVAVVGHDMHQRELGMPDSQGAAVDFVYNSEFVDEFYVMDDARGPYVPFRVFGCADNSMPCLEHCDIISVIAPIPEEVSLNYDDARTEFSRLGSDWNNFLQWATGEFPALGFLESRLESMGENPLVLRPSLLDSRRWKSGMLKSSIPVWLKHRYQAMHMPKYIWAIEVSDWSHANVAKRDERKICGEVILDASANPNYAWDSLLSFHIKGTMWNASGPGQNIDVTSGPGRFKWYPSLLRAI